MKNLVKLTTVLSLLALLFAACSNSIDSGSYDSSSSSSAGSTKTLTVSARGDNVDIIFDDTSRTIMPEALYAKDLDFYLWGTDLVDSSSTSGSALATPKKVTFTKATGQEDDSATKGTVALDLDISNYTLHLAAVSTGATAPTTETEAISAALLLADANVDLRYNEKVNFYLSPNNINGYGFVGLKVYSEWDSKPATTGYNIKVGIYDQVTGAAAGTGAEQPSSGSFDLYGTNGSVPADNNYTVTGAAIPAGTYNFVVTFTEASPASGATAKVFTYTDTILVLANRTTTGTVKVPDVIEKKPDTPEDLHVGYVNPSTPDSNIWFVEFDWTDKATNEAYFQLELLDITAVSTTGTEAGYVSALMASTNTKKVETPTATAASNAEGDTAWSNLKALTSSVKSYTFDYKVYENTLLSDIVQDNTTTIDTPRYIHGSLNKTSATTAQKLVLAVPTGSRWVARLCAVNDAGNSTYIYSNSTALTDGTFTSFSTGTTTNGMSSVSADVAKYTYTATKWTAAPLSISRFRIVYNLNNGLFYEAEDADGELKLTDSKPTDKTSSVFATFPGTAADETVAINSAKTKVVVFASHTTAGTLIINPIGYAYGSTTAYASLYEKGGENVWTSWKVDSTDGTDYATKNDDGKLYTAGFANINLYASYRVKTGNVYIQNLNAYNITDDMVSVFSGTESATVTTTTAVTVTGKTFSISTVGATPIKYIYFTLQDTKKYYKSAEFTVTKQGGSEQYGTVGIAGKTKSTSEGNDGFTWAVPVSNYKAGKYEAIYKAYTNVSKTPITYTLEFEITQ